MHLIIGKGIMVSIKAEYLKVTLTKPHAWIRNCMVTSTASVCLSVLSFVCRCFPSEHRRCVTVGSGLPLRESELHQSVNCLSSSLLLCHQCLPRTPSLQGSHEMDSPPRESCMNFHVLSISTNIYHTAY